MRSSVDAWLFLNLVNFVTCWCKKQSEITSNISSSLVSNPTFSSLLIQSILGKLKSPKISSLLSPAISLAFSISFVNNLLFACVPDGLL